MGTSRTLLGAVHAEEAQKGSKRPSKALPGAWRRASEQWNWIARAEAYDAHLRAEHEKSQAALRKMAEDEKARILSEGYALIHARVKTLDGITRRLIGYLDDEDNVWLPDVKSIGTGPNAQRVDLVRFNDALFSEIRGYLGDIASEMGERVKTTKQEHSGSLEFLIGARDALLQDLADLPDASQSQKQDSGPGVTPV